MLRLAAALMTITLTLAAPVRAEQVPVVVELFTSQGCSSCPPADALLHDLGKREDVIALALHVDYWDYIGWKDEFAIPGHTTRQQAYAHLGGRRVIYTPQMIINGEDSVVGARAMEIFDAISRQRSQPVGATLDVSRNGNSVRVQVAPVAGTTEKGEFAIVMVHYAPLKEVAIKRGENAGRTLSYANVVMDWHSVSTWDGTAAAEFEADIDSNFEAVVFVQRRGPGRIIAAARVQ